MGLGGETYDPGCIRRGVTKPESRPTTRRETGFGGSDFARQPGVKEPADVHDRSHRVRATSMERTDANADERECVVTLIDRHGLLHFPAARIRPFSPTC